MNGYIDGVDFINIEAEKYWTLPKTKKDIKTDIHNRIYSGDYMGSEKYDGIYERVVIDSEGNQFMIARNPSVSGEMTNKIEWCPQFKPFFDGLPNGTCLLCELHKETDSSSRKITTIMGCLKDKAIARQQKDGYLWLYVFDVWAYNNHSCLSLTARERFELLAKIAEKFAGAQYVHFAKYYEGDALWNELMRVMGSGGEGVVITRADSHAEPGKRTAQKTLKIKKELDNYIDCFLTGRYKPSTRAYNGDHIEDWKYWENEQTKEKFYGDYYKQYSLGEPYYPISKGYYNDWASAVEIGVYKGDEVYPVGWISGITEEVKDGIVNDPDNWIGRVVSINAMEIEPDTYKFRHAKIMEWRTDKTARECEFSQIANE